MSTSNALHKISSPDYSQYLDSSYTFPLMQNKCSAADAKTVVMQVMLDNIKNHAIRELGEKEQFMSPSHQLEILKKQLHRDKNQALDLLVLAEKMGWDVNIEADIKISFTTEETHVC